MYETSLKDTKLVKTWSDILFLRSDFCCHGTILSEKTTIQTIQTWINIHVD